MTLVPKVAGRPVPRVSGDGIRLTQEGQRLTLVVLETAVLAWFALLFLHGGDGSSILDHHRLGGGDHAHGATATEARENGADQHLEVRGGAGTHEPAGLTTSALVVLGGWSVMVLAMMLPPALPMLFVVGRLVSRHPYARLLLLAGAAAFVTAWTVVGAVMIAGDAALHTLTADLSPRWQLADLVPAAVLVGAGVFQLTPLKRSCLRACRSPRSFALAHWRGRRPPLLEVMTLSGAYALACIGCCWALMAISFAVGVAALPVMVVLAVFMAAERLTSWGHRLVRPAGILLIAIGLGVALPPFLAG